MNRLVLLEISTNIWSREVTGMPVVYATHKEFVKRGYSVHFVIPRDGNSHNEQHGIRIWRFWTPFYQSYPEKHGGGAWWIISRIQWTFFLIFGTLKMLRLAARLRPDVIYGHGTYGIPVAFFVGRLRGVPTISRTYGFALAQGYSRLEHLMNFELPLSLMLPADAYIIGDDGTHVRELSKRFGVRMDKAHFWIDGHDKNTYRDDFRVDEFKRSIGISTSDKVIVTVSSLTKYKGINYVIQAMPKIVEKLGNVTYLVLGKGPERENLEKLAEQLGVKDRVEFLGAVPHEEVWNYLSVADVVPCLWSIGPIFEAMICRRCAIVLDILEMRRFITDGETGILLNPNELDHLSDVIIRLLEDDELRKEIGSNARQWALKELDTVEERAAREAELVESLTIKSLG